MGKDGICFDDYATGYEAMICVRVHCAYLVRVVAKRLSRLVGLGFDMWGISGLDPTAGKSLGGERCIFFTDLTSCLLACTDWVVMGIGFRFWRIIFVSSPPT